MFAGMEAVFQKAKIVVNFGVWFLAVSNNPQKNAFSPLLAWLRLVRAWLAPFKPDNPGRLSPPRPSIVRHFGESRPLA